MKHKIVFFDMDGTLYQTENDVIQESALDAIQTLKDKGYIVCAATGRPLNQMKLILQRVQFDYYVLINGSYILDKDFQEIGSYPILQPNGVHPAVDVPADYSRHCGRLQLRHDQLYPGGAPGTDGQRGHCPVQGHDGGEPLAAVLPAVQLHRLEHPVYPDAGAGQPGPAAL